MNTNTPFLTRARMGKAVSVMNRKSPNTFTTILSVVLLAVSLVIFYVALHE